MSSDLPADSMNKLTPTADIWARSVRSSMAVPRERPLLRGDLLATYQNIPGDRLRFSVFELQARRQRVAIG